MLPGQFTEYKPTRTEATMTRYIKRAEQLIAHIPKENLSNPDIGAHPKEVVNWYFSKIPSWRKATVRQNKAIFIGYFEYVAEKYPDTASDYSNAINLMNTTQRGAGQKRNESPPRTSSHKVKQVNFDDLRSLESIMIPLGGWNHRAYSFLASGVTTGLRPAEWERTTLQETKEDGTLVLNVVNAKNSNGRACGYFRLIEVMPGWGADCVKAHRDNIQNWLSEGFSYEAYYSACRLALHRTVRNTWKTKSKHYTLYSARHQYCSNLKFSGMFLREIANRMGHASEKTAQGHYGKAKHGHASFAPKVQEISVTKVAKKPLDSSMGRKGNGLGVGIAILSLNGG